MLRKNGASAQTVMGSKSFKKYTKTLSFLKKVRKKSLVLHNDITLYGPILSPSKAYRQIQFMQEMYEHVLLLLYFYLLNMTLAK